MPQRGRSGQPAKGRLASRPKPRKVSTAAPSIADLQKQVGTLTRELKEANERQTASAEVLRVINSSPGDLAPVFDAILEKAHNFCGVSHGSLQLYDGEKFRAVAVHGISEAFADRLRQGFVPGPKHPSQPLLKGARFAQVPDCAGADDPLVRAAFELAGIRAVLFIPLRKDDSPLGQIAAARREAMPFTEKEIALLENFAAQAVIAIENARLLGELRERTADLARSVDELTATGDVLKIISRSSVDLETVLDTLVETVARLCRAEQAVMFRRLDERYHVVASCGLPDEAKDFLLSHPLAANRGTLSGRVELERRPIQIGDVLQDPEYAYLEGQRIQGYRTMLGVPLLRQDSFVGIFIINRTRVEPFTDKEIELASTFADQAVIAIENARLFEELRQSLQQQTATADVLKVISRSAFDLGSVLQTLVESAARLCEADKATITRQTGEVFYRAEFCGFSDEFMDHLRRIPIKPERGSASGRALLERQAIHILDVLSDPEYTLVEEANWGGFRTALAVPILREGVPIGVLSLTRSEMRPFTEKQIELVSIFADQAAIAIENARLVAELRERQGELRVTFDNMGDGVVMFGADTRLVAWNRNFQTILDLPDELLAQRPTYVDYVHILAERGEFGNDIEAELSRRLQDTNEELRLERTRPDGRVIEVRRNPVPGGGFVLIYSDITQRKRAEEAIRAARDAAETALHELQMAQASLVHAQKMAALGQVTAGIAHEIKNPLNFVNNFAGLSVELLDELKEAAALSTGTLDPTKRAEILETIRTVTGNLEKIVEHGRRADGIVRSMLQHSRGGSDDWQATDLNALIEEALNLAYHGARAQDPNFDVTLERDLDLRLASVDVVPQELTRVLLNLIGNGFYAAGKRSREGDGTYRPALKVTTREFGECVEVRVRDNGIGIPPENREKLFQPFFTTKPTGEGTGLGLSISYEIVTQQHGGTISVDSEVGDFTEFTMRLPRRRHAVAARMG
jgi:two-component system, NtrC family, sensor kinase